MKLRTFVFALPPYDPKSNGVHLYYEIAEMFRRAGHRVLATPLNNSKIHQDLLSANFLTSPFELIEPTEVRPDWVPVFPDTSLHHFSEQFETKCRIWYLLNKPYALTGEACNYRPNDMVLCYSKFISNIYPVFFFNRYNPRLRSFITPELRDRPKKNRILFYIGKCVNETIPDSVHRISEKFRSPIVTINRAVPEKQEHLWQLIRSSRLVVSTDPVTNLNYESTLLGTPCYIADNYTRTDYSNYEIPLPGIFDNEELLERMYLDGIPDEVHHQILATYDATTSNHSVTLERMLACIDTHLERSTKKDESCMHQHNDEINRLRLENDRLQQQVGLLKNPAEPNLAVGFSLKPYLTPFSRLKFAALKVQSFLLLVLLRVTTNTAVAYECFHKMESFRTKARRNAVARSFYKQARGIKK